MVDDRMRDGSRIGELLSSEVHGHGRGVMGRLAVVDADRDATPSAGGTFAYAVEYESPPPAGERRVIAAASLHQERLRLDFSAAPETAIEAAEAAGLPSTTTGAGGRGAGGLEGADAPDSDTENEGDVQRGEEVERGEDDDRMVVSVSVESGAAVKQALRVVRAVAEALDEEVREP